MAEKPLKLMFLSLRHGKIKSRTRRCYSTHAPLTKPQLSRSYAVAEANLTSKICTKCKEHKTLDKFIPDSRYLHGCTAWCRACKGDYVRQWGKRNAWKNRHAGTNPSKVCNKCGIEKPAGDFPGAHTKKDGLGSRCKQCRNESATAEGRRATPEYRLKTRLWQLYRMTVDQYTAMLEAQNGACAICETTLGTKPNIDHCHTSRKIRGLLCSRCNSWLAAIEHPTFPVRAREYLRRFT